MSLSLNTVMLAGNLTRDPEVKMLANENAVCKFGLAVNRRWKDKSGEKREETTFVDVECWGKLANLVGQYCQKGKPVYVEGRLKLDQWEDKDGAKRSKLAVVAEEVQFLGNAKGRSDDDTQALPPTQAAAVIREKAERRGLISPADDDNSPPF